MIPALFLALVLPAPIPGVHLPSGSQYSISGGTAYIFDRNSLDAFSLGSIEKRVPLDAVSDALKKRGCTVNDVSLDSGRILVSGIENGKSGRRGFAAVFSEKDQSLLDYWTVGSGYPVAQRLSGDTVLLALVQIQSHPTPSIIMSVKEYTTTGDFMRDRMAPVEHDDLDRSIFLAALPYFQLQEDPAGVVMLVDPSGPTIVSLLSGGKVSELSIRYKITQFLPLVRKTIFSSFFRCGDRSLAIVQGIRPTKKIVPYMMEVTPKGTVRCITPLDAIQVYHVEPQNETSFAAEYFDASVKGRVLKRVSCDDLTGLLSK